MKLDLALIASAPTLLALGRQTPNQPEQTTQPREALPVVGAGATATQVSDAARLLRGVLQALPLSAGTTAGSPAPLALAPPLIDPASAPSATPAQLSARLQQVLEQSGAFYEAHQARWSQGRFDIEALRREPQARLAPVTDEHVASGTSAALVAAPELHRETEPTAQQSALAPKTEAAPPAARLSVPAAMLPMLEQQLHFLASGELLWRGQAWPGQELQWRVAQEQGQGAHEGAPERAWQTTLRMHLPQLGEIDAQLWVSGGDVGLRLRGEAHALARFRAALPALASAFDRAGIALKSALVQAHE